MNRKQFLKLSAVAGFGGGVGGCVSLEELKELEKRPEGVGTQVFSAVMVIAKYRASAAQRAQAKRAAGQIIVHRGLVPVAKARVKRVESERRAKPRSVVPRREEKQEVAGSDPVELEKLEILATELAIAEQIAGPNHGVQFDLAAIQYVAMNPALGKELLADVGDKLGETIAVGVEKGESPAERQNTSSVTMMMINTRRSELVNGNAYVMNSTPLSGRKIDLDGIGAVFYS